MQNLRRYFGLFSFALLATILLGAAFAVGFYSRAVLVEQAEVPLPPGLAAGGDTYPLLKEIRDLLAQRYINSLPDQQTLEYGAARGLVSAVGDQYTVFIEPQSHELETNSLSGEYGGIGVELLQTAGGLFALYPYPDSPAAAAGILGGDILLAVDGEPVAPGATMDDVAARIRGPVGTTVIIRVRHPGGDEAEYSLARQNIPLPSVEWRLLTEDASIGLITISRFSGRTSEELQRAAADLLDRGATRFILDLRENGGGILDSAVQVAGQFLDGGVVMYESQREAPEKVYTAPANTGPLASAPLAVLVNHNTASAAEIVAGALLDRGRAPLIGQPTYGKGSVQLVFDLSDGSSLHVTAYLWYTPARREIEQVGLPPSIGVEPGPDGSDPILARAVKYLQTGQ